MVYNIGGGNKSKGLARKFVVQSHANSSGSGKTVRVVKEDGEQYAIVQKHLGNCMCAVMCSDGYRRLCIIRKKFTGRRKTDNNISSGSVVLVGLHDYSSGGVAGGGAGGGNGGGNGGDIKRCDLLYVYSEQEKEKLRKVCDLSKLSSSLEDTSGQGGKGSHALQTDSGSDIAFITSGTGVFNKYANDEARRQQQPQQPKQPLVKNVISGSDWLDDLPPLDEDEESEENEEERESTLSASEEEEEDEDAECQVVISAPSKPSNKINQKDVIDIDDI